MSAAALRADFSAREGGAVVCETCNGAGQVRPKHGERWCYWRWCEACNGVGYHGVPVGPTDAAPGSPWKITVLAARYAAEVDLFHTSDGLAGPMSDEELRL